MSEYWDKLMRATEIAEKEKKKDLLAKRYSDRQIEDIILNPPKEDAETE